MPGVWRADRTRLLEEDPELGKWLTPDEVAVAREHAVVPVLRIGPGPWVPPACENRSRHLGLLVLGGIIARDEALGGAVATDFFGAGELLQPWADAPGERFVPRRIRWTVLVPARLAVLGPSFCAVSARWPVLRSALLERAAQRCWTLATQHAISQLARVDMRLLVLFWHLAERWGRAVPSGVLLPMPMTHTMLGRLAGAKRPTVTRSLQRLCTYGFVERRDDGWLLLGEPAEALRRLERTRLEPDLHHEVRKEPVSLRVS
jgi:CRP/FNR family transcriptional regulator, cyclic AMP receptor protein